MSKVLFVCLGNICRSPMAEAVFKKQVVDAGLSEKIQVASAGTSSWEAGNLPHAGTQDILKKHGISCDSMFSTQVTPKDFVTYDYILAMDQNNLRELKKGATASQLAKLHLFLENSPESGYTEVPDPYYTGDFELTYQLVNKGCQGWLETIKKAVT